MPRATLSYKLPEEKEEHRLALKGVDYCIALENLRNYLRGKVKYESHPPELSVIYEELYQKVNDEIDEANQ